MSAMSLSGVAQLVCGAGSILIAVLLCIHGFVAQRLTAAQGLEGFGLAGAMPLAVLSAGHGVRWLRQSNNEARNGGRFQEGSVDGPY